ncbi:hypothetical protein B0A55_07750 [Friedmanniomyces simplex]|uniref:Uncharacterized protein n=1 Tax=Friedmanniomyces simplex TaxID=329884 RepID=A0A4U0XDD9_9PEZI|nr:hypothetical protein B0A55_07750 [Friedmanniomyces simplex]
MPSAVPGLQFAAKRRYLGYELHFSLSYRGDGTTTDLVVQASKNGKQYELVTPELFRAIYPAAFSEEYFHWNDVDAGVVEFRPIKDAWSGSGSRTWTLIPDQRTATWRLTKDSQVLLSLPSATSKALTSILLPLADPNRIHPPLLEVEVEIPGLQLCFLLEAKQSELRSKEFPNTFIDRDQSLGVLVGLQNRLILRYRNTGARLLLVLDGNVSYDFSDNDGRHVSVIAQKTATSRIHTFRVDTVLGCLGGNGNLQSKLFLAYLHALTTFCLPDPLTRQTGTEQALSLLRSAEVRSFDRLTEENLALVQQIAALTPVRQYYPANERVMQTVHWSSRLGFLAQHAEFSTAVGSIFNQARRSSIFYPETRLPELEESDLGLMQRHAVRSAMLRVSGFGAEDFTVMHDASYRARDQDQASTMFSQAFVMSRMVYQQKLDLQMALSSDVSESL